MLAFKKAYCTTDAVLGRASMEALTNNRLKKNKVENIKSKTLCKIYMLTKAIN